MSDQPIEPRNAFTKDYLDAVRGEDDPSTSREAETSGPFTLVEQHGMPALYRAWENATEGDLPLALFHQRETALLFQALWPALGRHDLHSPGGLTLPSGGGTVPSLGQPGPRNPRSCPREGPLRPREG